MANGDAAAAAGLETFASTQDRRLGYDNDNIRGDELADHMVNGGHDWSKITGKPSTYPAANGSVTTPKIADGAVTNAKIANQTITSGKIGSGAVGASELQNDSVDQQHIRTNAVGQAELQSDAVDTRHIATGAVTPTKLGPAITLDEADTVTSNAYSRSVSGGGYYAMWMGENLKIGRNVSSRRYKEDIEPHGLDPAKVLSLQPVSYHRKGDPSGYEYGLIAEDVDDAGLPELVVTAPGSDVVDGLRYDLLAVALLDVVKNQEARIAALESKETDQ